MKAIMKRLLRVLCVENQDPQMKLKENKMQQVYTIEINEGLGSIPIGFFINEVDRDEAFNTYIMPKYQWCMKGTKKV